LSYENRIGSLLKDWENNVIAKINENETIGEISQFLLHLARIVNYPNLDVKYHMSKIQELGDELRSKVKNQNQMRPTGIIEKLNEFFFYEKNFKPNINDYYNPSNNYLNIVIEQRTGIPITLSIVYAHMASFLNFELEPVNFPSHFLVKHSLDKNSNEYIVIDPFNKGRIMDDYLLQDLLNKIYPKSYVSVSNDILEKASARQILVRILNNLKMGYAETDDLDRIELINEMILSTSSSNPEAIRDRGIILYRHKKFEKALENLHKYIEINPEASDIDHILELIHQIRRLGDNKH
jgi:regulator of sirC expression with transglutaminase-like and TPR domain